MDVTIKMSGKTYTKIVTVKYSHEGRTSHNEVQKQIKKNVTGQSILV
jgi:hypothetical protein